jgi:hypothetical protein
MKAVLRTFALCALLLAAGAASAQDQQQEQKHRRGTPEDRAKKQTEMLKKQLSLTDEQTPKVEAIMLAFNVDLQKDFENQTNDGPWHPDPKLIDKRNADLQKVLTPEQFEKFMKLPMAKSMGPRGPRDGGMGGPGGMPGGGPDGPGM